VGYVGQHLLRRQLFRRSETELSTATFAIVVEIGDDGVPQVVLHGTVGPELPRTSQAAEHCGRVAAVQLLFGHAVLHGDCKPVVAAGKLPARLAAHHKRFHAGTRRLADSSLHAHLVDADIWVKAHRKTEQAIDEVDRRHILGNGAADSHAVLAQRLHPQISGSMRNKLARDDDKMD
jgi:hypothetical protein